LGRFGRDNDLKRWGHSNRAPKIKDEPGTIVADKDFVIVHGRFVDVGFPVNRIAADILRIKDGTLFEHWDVIQDEATRESSKSVLPMFADKFGK
jgi:predicted SnoaL-like aldol condensation-catalyzing enzyme